MLLVACRRRLLCALGRALQLGAPQPHLRLAPHLRLLGLGVLPLEPLRLLGVRPAGLADRRGDPRLDQSVLLRDLLRVVLLEARRLALCLRQPIGQLGHLAPQRRLLLLEIALAARRRLDLS
eukprot:4943348-Prymnesium_polylepis.1